MTGDTAVEVPVVDNKTEEVVMTDKEVIAEEEKEAEKTEVEAEEKQDEPEKTEDAEKVPEKKIHLFQKLFGKRKDYVVPKIDDTVKTDKEIIVEEEGEKKEEEENKEEEEEKEEEKKDEPEKLARFKKMFSMKKKEKKEEPEKEEVEKIEEKAEEKVEENVEEKKDEEKKDEEKIEEATAEADVSVTTAEKKTLLQKLMTIKKDLMANKKVEEKPEEEKKEEEVEEKVEKKEEEEEKEGEEKTDDVKEDDTKDELGNEKPVRSNRIKKFFSMKRPRRTTETEEVEEKKEEETVEKVEEEAVAEDTVEQTLRLHLTGRTLAIPSISPMNLKLESWLKFHEVKYENTLEKDSLPASAYQPLKANEFLTELAAKHEKEMPAELTADQKITQHAMLSLVEKNIHFAILAWQCRDMDNIIKGYKINLQQYNNSKAPIPLLRLLFKTTVCKNGNKMVKNNGFGQKTAEEMDTLAKEDLKVLTELLGEQDFYFGAEPSLLDLVTFSHLAQITVVEEAVACSLREYLTTECPTLVALVERMKERCWGEHWVAATEQLEMNPHIPKPVLEEVKEIVEEVIAEATKEEVVEEKVVEVEEKKEETTEEKVDEGEKKEE